MVDTPRLTRFWYREPRQAFVMMWGFNSLLPSFSKRKVCMMTHQSYANNLRNHRGYCAACGKAVWVSRNGDSNIAYVATQGGAKTCLDCAVCAHEVPFKRRCTECEAEIKALHLFG